MADGFFAQGLAAKVREVDRRKVHIAEFWLSDRFKGVVSPPQGLGFDATWHDGLRDTLRRMIGQAAGGRNAHVQLGGLADRLRHAVFRS